MATKFGMPCRAQVFQEGVQHDLYTNVTTNAAEETSHRCSKNLLRRLDGSPIPYDHNISRPVIANIAPPRNWIHATPLISASQPTKGARPMAMLRAITPASRNTSKHPWTMKNNDSLNKVPKIRSERLAGLVFWHPGPTYMYISNHNKKDSLSLLKCKWPWSNWNLKHLLSEEVHSTMTAQHSI